MAINSAASSGNCCRRLLRSNLLLVAVILATSIHDVTARTWLDVVVPKEMYAADRIGYKRIRVSEYDPFVESPTISPAPTDEPTRMPSKSPTAVPTTSPTFNPTATPTLSPTAAPTTEFYVKEPKDPERGYFNYDPNSDYGPSKWDDLKDRDVESTTEAKYWDDFSKFIKPSLSSNKCDSKSDKQSPIDVNMNDARGECLQYHEFRHKPGEGRLGEEIKVKILPSKLRIEYDSDVGIYNADKRSFGSNPAADVPKAWGDQLPVIRADFKVPSEHWMEGKQYAAEYQIWQIQNRPDVKRGAPVMSILIDVDDDKHNEHLQRALDVFQDVWDADMADCENERRRQRRLDAVFYRKLRSWIGFGNGDEELIDDEELGFSTILDEPPEEEEKFQALRGKLNERRLQDRRWDPWHTDLYRTVWFYGYLGSLTEPPCTEFVEWHVMDKPAKMSKAQLYQMKKLLFHHVDGKCKRTSVGFNGSVARPIQKMRDRDLYKCSCDNFLSDYQVIEEGRKNCQMVKNQSKDVTKKMDQNGKDDKPWTVRDDDWPGNGSDLKGYCGKCKLDRKDFDNDKK